MASLNDQCEAVKAETVHDRAASRLDAEIEELHYAINGLESMLAPVLGVPSTDCIPTAGEDSPGSSPIVLRAHDAGSRVASATRRLREIQHRLEV